MSRRASVMRLLEGLARRLGGAEITYVGPDDTPPALPKGAVEPRGSWLPQPRRDHAARMREVRVRLIGMLRTLDEIEDSTLEEQRSRLHAIEEALIEINRELDELRRGT